MDEVMTNGFAVEAGDKAWMVNLRKA